MTTLFTIDFDGTCVEHEYPRIGADVPGAADTLRELTGRGDLLILWTMRSDGPLADAVAWFERRGIEIVGANESPGQASWTNSPKAYAHVYIDDAALGCPLVHPPAGTPGSPRPYVDWPAVRRLLGLDPAAPSA